MNLYSSKSFGAGGGSLRIAQVNLQPDFGGAERYTLLLAEGLRARGHDVTLLCHPRGRLKKQADERAVPVETAVTRNQLDLSGVARLAARLRRLRPDVLHLQTSKEYVSGLVAARLSRVPVVVASRHLLLPVKPVMRLLFRHFDAVLVLSRAVQDNLIRYGVPEAKVNVIYAGIDTEEFSNAAGDGRGRAARRAFGVPDERLFVGIAGRMVEGKGHSCLLDAMALLAREGVPVTLALVGEGPLRTELELQTRRLGIEAQVIFAGFHPDLPAFMAALDVFVMASTCAEVMPLVLMEAMAAGCAVVATRVGGVPEIIETGRTGLLVAPGDASGLAGALRCLASDSALRAQLSAAGSADVLQRFTVNRMVSETEQMYTRLCAAHAD